MAQMKQTVLFVVLSMIGMAMRAQVLPDNEIWYVASERLTVADDESFPGLHADGFDAEIIAHTFSEDKGIIRFDTDVTSIGEGTFNECTELTSITIPGTVTSIGDRAFAGCSCLTGFVVPKSVMMIGGNVFGGCSAMTSIAVEPGNKKYDSRNGCNAIIETATNTIVAGCRATVLPKSVTAIGDGAFIGCKRLTDITLPKSVTGIGSWAFAGCVDLVRIKWSNSVTTIGESAFQDCSSLTAITLPKSTASVGESAFAYCSGLKDVTLPKSVTSIGRLAFSYCTDLASVKVGWATPLPISADVFLDTTTGTCTLYVPKGTSALYRSAPVWKDFGDIKEF